MTDLGHGKMSQDGVVLTDLEVTHAQFVFLVFEAAFHGPACEGDMQDGFEGRSRCRVGDEVFAFVRIEYVVGIDEPIRAEYLAVALQPKGCPFDFPDHRPLVGVLEIDAQPRLPQHDA